MAKWSTSLRLSELVWKKDRARVGRCRSVSSLASFTGANAANVQILRRYEKLQQAESKHWSGRVDQLLAAAILARPCESKAQYSIPACKSCIHITPVRKQAKVLTCATRKGGCQN